MQDLIDVYRELAARCDYPLHLGLTEAGMGAKGIVAASAALAVLLQEGIGDTIRVSLTPAPNGDRTEEVLVCQQILQSLGIRSFTPQVTACPGCGRTTSTFFQEMASRFRLPAGADAALEGRYPGVEEMKVAVMGCVVNGPGESKHSNIGISLPGTFEEPKAPVYVDGRLMTTLKGDHIVAEFITFSRTTSNRTTRPKKNSPPNKCRRERPRSCVRTRNACPKYFPIPKQKLLLQRDPFSACPLFVIFVSHAPRLRIPSSPAPLSRRQQSNLHNILHSPALGPASGSSLNSFGILHLGKWNAPQPAWRCGNA